MPFQFTCEICGTTFERHQRRHPKNPFRFCSRVCMNQRPLAERFWSKVDRTGGPDACWPWTGSRIRQGYGRINIDGALVLTHRVAFFLAFERWPACALHKCDNPPCCNPSHLFEGTYADNAADREAKGRGNQPRGSANPRAKLSEADVRAIREDARRGEAHSLIARRYGVSAHAIYSVVLRRTWAHVE